eukprot:1984101-Alexandrium_andersonii.AAC.1
MSASAWCARWVATASGSSATSLSLQCLRTRPALAISCLRSATASHATWAFSSMSAAWASATARRPLHVSR